MPKAYDLTNQRFGRLTALYKCDFKLGNKYPWHCKCDCGNECDVRTQDLTRGSVQSCGCLRKEKASQTGKTYKDNLIPNQSKDITGQRFGRLIAIENTGEKRNRSSIWKCLCDCGNTTFVRINDLTSGNTSSCGCLKSRGQEKISSILRKNNIPFETEKTFPETNLGNMRFDFFVKDSYVIEYDGIQHFKENGFFEDLQDQSRRDKAKNDWCKANNIPIIRIPYTIFSSLSLQDLLLETSKYKLY